MRALLAFSLVSLNAFAAGPLIIGVRGGAPFTDTNTVAGAVTNSLGIAERRFQVGPTLGVRLPLGFSVEGDALYSRQSLDLFQFASTSSSSWEFPVMLKFTAGHGAVAPVFGAGATVRHISDFGAVPSFIFNGATSPNTVGFVAGGGFRLKLGPVNITPEVRYTRWSGDSFSQSFLNLLPLSRNEGSVLVGVTF
jgi:hypothetical protein